MVWITSGRYLRKHFQYPVAVPIGIMLCEVPRAGTAVSSSVPYEGTVRIKDFLINTTVSILAELQCFNSTSTILEMLQ